MEPFYFGTNDHRLFGVYHAPETRRAGAPGVVLCHPAFEEYTVTYRALRQLAVLLARGGAPVLRFDYFGTGDSWGQSDQADLGRWRSDVLAAVEELRAISGATAISLVGLRLGATLAAQAACQRREIASLILWDPIVYGGTYLAELRAAHRRAVPAQPGHFESANVASEGLLGYPIPDSLSDALGRLDLTRMHLFGGSRIVLITSGSPEHDVLLEHLRQQVAQVQRHHDVNPPLWAAGTVDRQLVPAATLQTIVEQVG